MFNSPPLLPSLLRAVSGSPFPRQLSQMQYFSSWLSSPPSSRPGSAGRSSSFLEPLEGRWAGLLEASSGVSQLLSDAPFGLTRGCRAGVTSSRTCQPAHCKTGVPSTDWESCNCNLTGLAAASGDFWHWPTPSWQHSSPLRGRAVCLSSAVI